MTESISFSRYGKQFQESLSQLILQDRPFADQIEEVLNVSFFELRYLRVFISLIYDYRKKYGVHPTEKILASILRTELDNFSDTVQKQTRDFFARVLIKSVQDEQYIKDTSLDFCKKQKLKEALMTGRTQKVTASKKTVVFSTKQVHAHNHTTVCTLLCSLFLTLPLRFACLF